MGLACLSHPQKTHSALFPLQDNQVQSVQTPEWPDPEVAGSVTSLETTVGTAFTPCKRNGYPRLQGHILD